MKHYEKKITIVEKWKVWIIEKLNFLTFPNNSPFLTILLQISWSYRRVKFAIKIQQSIRHYLRKNWWFVCLFFHNLFAIQRIFFSFSLSPRFLSNSCFFDSDIYKKIWSIIWEMTCFCSNWRKYGGIHLTSNQVNNSWFW